MSDAVVQTGRLLALTTPLGADVLIPTAVTGEEGLSRLFNFTIDAVSTKLSIAPADLLGKSVTLAIIRQGETSRYINGIVYRFSAGGTAARGLRGYRLEIVPDLWKMTRTSDCRVFQDSTVLDIVEKLLGDAGISNFKKQGISGTHNAREYCVQYRESDFAFFSRLLEEEGIYYYFSHEDGKHTLVLSDSVSGYGDCLDASVEYGSGGQGAEQVIDAWEPAYAFQSGQWSLDDHDFENPSTDLVSTTATVLSVSAFKAWERFDYPGGFSKAADGKTLSRLRMEADEADYQTVRGGGGYRGFTPGLKFTLAKYPVSAEQNQSYVLTAVQVNATDLSHLGNQGAVQNYSNVFTAIPAATVFRPPLTTPRPVVQGPQTAVVTGPSGEEIYTDKYGRVKVQFHWDRLGKKDESSSCYVRVAQMVAGKGWGSQFIPRVGMEVVVSFLEGDPDRPLVVGCVYNGENTLPYALPDNKTQSGLKTRSSTGGDASTFNELRFEDKKDAEEVYFHAQKDFKRMVENDDTLQVDHNQAITIKNDRSLTVSEGNESTTVAKGNRTVTVAEGNDSLTVSKGNRSETISAGNRSVTVSKGNDTHTVSQGNATLSVGQGDYALKLGTGNVSVKTDSGKVTIEAMQAIELKVGANSVKIDTTGVSITGTLVKLTANGQCQIKGAMVQVNGDGMVQVKGGVVTIN